MENAIALIEGAKGPWNFSLTSATLKAYGQGGYSQYFPPSAIVGQATSGQVISFSFDCEANIEIVFWSVSGDIL